MTFHTLDYLRHRKGPGKYWRLSEKAVRSQAWRRAPREPEEMVRGENRKGCEPVSMLPSRRSYGCFSF